MTERIPGDPGDCPEQNPQGCLDCQYVGDCYDDPIKGDRETTPEQRFHAYMKGWRDGASGTPEAELLVKWPQVLQSEYRSGHYAGRNARRSSINVLCKRLGITVTQALKARA